MVEGPCGSACGVGRREAGGAPELPSAPRLPPVLAALKLKGIVGWEGEGTEQDLGERGRAGRIHRCQSHRSESWDLGLGKGGLLLPVNNLDFPRLRLGLPRPSQVGKEQQEERGRRGAAGG